MPLEVHPDRIVVYSMRAKILIGAFFSLLLMATGASACLCKGVSSSGEIAVSGTITDVVRDQSNQISVASIAIHKAYRGLQKDGQGWRYGEVTRGDFKVYTSEAFSCKFAFVKGAPVLLYARLDRDGIPFVDACSGLYRSNPKYDEHVAALESYWPAWLGKSFPWVPLVFAGLALAGACFFHYDKIKAELTRSRL